MGKRVFEIGDTEGNSFRISVVVPFKRSGAGSWRSLNKGYIRYNSGATANRSGRGRGGDDDELYLLSPEGRWIIVLDDYQDFWGLNDQGTGQVQQSSVLQLKPGTITWSLID